MCEKMHTYHEWTPFLWRGDRDPGPQTLWQLLTFP